jgi:hypothetical protein
MARRRAGSVSATHRFLNFSRLVALITAAWLAPSGPFSTPRVVERVVVKVEDVGIDFVRLAGPLRSNKIVPIHNYTTVLPFQGSIRLGDREVLSVNVTTPGVQGPLALRGTTYDTYESGGWKAGERDDSRLSGQAPGLTSRSSARWRAASSV